MSDRTDPFLIDQAALESKLKLLQENFDRWRQIRDSRDVAEFVASAEEFNWLCLELSQGIKNAGWDLDDLEETLKLMSESRQLAVSDTEYRNRRQFIANARQMLSQISGEVLPSAGRGTSATVASGRRGVGIGDSELLTTVSGVGGSGINVDHFAEEPASLDLLDPGDEGDGGAGVGYGGRTAAWKRRLGAAVTFGPLRQMGLADGGSGASGGGCWTRLMRHRMRLLGAALLALLFGLLIAGIVLAARKGEGSGGGVANSTTNASATSTP